MAKALMWRAWVAPRGWLVIWLAIAMISFAAPNRRARCFLSGGKYCDAKNSNLSVGTSGYSSNRSHACCMYWRAIQYLTYQSKYIVHKENRHKINIILWYRKSSNTISFTVMPDFTLSVFKFTYINDASAFQSPNFLVRSMCFWRLWV